MPECGVIGWDIGGAHVKAARREGGRIVDAAQWPCPLWQGMDRLDAALALAATRWPDLAGLQGVTVINNSFGEEFDRYAKDKLKLNQVASLDQATA